MNLSNIILQFAKACKDAQTILNTEGTGGKEGNVPVLIKEAEFKGTSGKKDWAIFFFV